MFKNLSDWKTTVTGLVIVILQALPIIGFEIPENVEGFFAWLGGLLLLISGDPDTTAKLKSLKK